LIIVDTPLKNLILLLPLICFFDIFIIGLFIDEEDIYATNVAFGKSNEINIGYEDLTQVKGEHLLCFQWFIVGIMVSDEFMVIVVVISILTFFYQCIAYC